MPICAAAVGALATFYQEPETDKNVDEAIVRLIAKLPTIAAYAYKHSLGQPLMYPRNDLDYSANFMRMMFGTPCAEYMEDPVIAQAIDQLLILHADHEQNCSTSTVRLVGSSLPPLFASISAGIGALWGPLHGGANPEGDRDARRDDRERRRSAAVHRACPEPARRVPAHGVRPPRV